MRTKATPASIAVLVLGAAVLSAPLAYALLSSLMSPNEVLRYFAGINSPDGRTALHLLPDAPTLDAYYQVLLRRPDYLVKFWNSLLIAGSVALGQALVCTLAGYGFSRLPFPGSGFLFSAVVVLMMMPLQVTLVPNYLVLTRLGLVGGYGAVILPAVFSAFGVFLAKLGFDTLPPGQLEAATLDGANAWQVFRRVALPANRSAVGALAILGFVDAWNMVEQPLIFLKDRSQYPLSLFLAQAGGQNLALGFACGVLALLPVALLLLFFEQELVSGISLSSVK